MCVSASISFGMAGLLIAGGAFAARKSYTEDRRYMLLAVFPILVGIQQIMEGFVWTVMDAGDQAATRPFALGYLFFVWMIWPVWVPCMTASLENDSRKKRLFLHVAQVGFLMGIFLYLPNFWHTDWLKVETLRHSIAYQCTQLTDGLISQNYLYLLYLVPIALPPLLSSHRALRIFGAWLVFAVPVTYLAFSYAQLSVLCFFAAAMTLYIIYIILEDKCGKQSAAPAKAHFKAH